MRPKPEAAGRPKASRDLMEDVAGFRVECKAEHPLVAGVGWTKLAARPAAGHMHRATCTPAVQTDGHMTCPSRACSTSMCCHNMCEPTQARLARMKRRQAKLVHAEAPSESGIERVIPWQCWDRDVSRHHGRVLP